MYYPVKLRDALRYKPSHDSEGLANNIVNYITVIAQGGAMATRPAPLSRYRVSGWNENTLRIDQWWWYDPGCLVRRGTRSLARRGDWNCENMQKSHRSCQTETPMPAFFVRRRSRGSRSRGSTNATPTFLRERGLGGSLLLHPMPAERMIWTRESLRGKRLTSMLASYARIVDRGSPEDPGA